MQILMEAGKEKMKAKQVLLFVLFLNCFAFGISRAELLLNGGFESGGSEPDGWYFDLSSGASSDYIIDSNLAQEGERFIELSVGRGSYSRAYQDVSVSEGESYILNVYVQDALAEVNTRPFRVRFEFKDGVGDVLRVDESNFSVGNAWKKFSLLGDSAPAGAVSATVVLAVESSLTKIDFDNASMDVYGGDLDGDGNIDKDDLKLFVEAWLTDDPNVDFSGDDAVNLCDFAWLGENWLAGIESVDADHPCIQYMGRVVFDDPKAPLLGWPGTSVVAKFKGKSIRFKLNDPGDNYVNVIVDEGEPIVLDCVEGEATYDVASGLSDSVHEIEIYKRTEHSDGALALGFELDAGDKLVLPPERPTRRIEFYGDSITVGLALESVADDQDPEFTNNYLAYGAVTARNLAAEYHCIAVSGIGLLVSWWPENMPDHYYYRHNPDDGSSYWDFGQWVPDVVVVNLGQNDYWLSNPTPAVAEQGYVDFVLALRGEYTDAEIILCLGSMNATQDSSPWPGYIEAAVNTLNTIYGDAKVHYTIFPYDGLGTHPHEPQHAAMAAQLTTFIEGIMGW